MNQLADWLHLPVFFLLVYLLWQPVRGKGLGLVFWSALLFKLGCGVVLGWIYLNYLDEGGDTWTSHTATLKVVEAATQNPSWYLRFLFFNDVTDTGIGWSTYSNSLFFLKPLSLFYFLTNSSYWWSGAYLSLFSFWGCWFLVQKLGEYFPQFRMGALIAFLYFPSVVFWTSGVTKDALFMGSLCLTVGLFLQLYKATKVAESWRPLLWLFPCIWLLWRIKFFLAAVVLVLLTTFLAVKWLVNRVEWLRPTARQCMVWLGLLVIGAFIASFAHPTFKLDFFVRHILWNYHNLLAITDLSKPHLAFPHLQPTVVSVVLHAPSAVFQMLCRPFIWEPAPLLYKLMAVESLVLVLVVLLCVFQLVKTRRLPQLPSFLAALLVFFIISAVLVTLPTPNLGSLHRYRAPLLPFFLLVVISWGPIPHWIKRLSSRRR
ncbi:hypothetical protein [Rufibacter psychrotolerans]|uniref:hypothetical protein n=1 Tax=Rufibacter psychrotolerans TaxID=2812556 RepID=UPI001968A408|nr:hypothetical protein [Rufibacter sp. SYSU D00308]